MKTRAVLLVVALLFGAVSLTAGCGEEAEPACHTDHENGDDMESGCTDENTSEQECSGDEDCADGEVCDTDASPNECVPEE